RAPRGLLAAGVEHAFDAVALHLTAELAAPAGHLEREVGAGELDVLERHLAAVEPRAAVYARELLAQLERGALAADRGRHLRGPDAGDLRRHDVHVDERGGHAAD